MSANASVRMDNRLLSGVDSPFRAQWFRFAAAAAVTVAATICGFGVPIVIQVVLDTVWMRGAAPDFPVARAALRAVGGAGVVRNRMWIPALAILILSIGNGWFSYLAGRWSAVGAESAAETMRNRLYRHIHDVSVAFHRKSSSGDLVQRCTSDVDTVRKFFAIQVIEVGRACAMVGLAVPLMLRLSGRLTVVAVALLPVAFVYTLQFFRNVETAFTASDEAEGALSGLVQEHLSGLRVVRAFAQEPAQFEQFSARNEDHRDKAMRLMYLLAQYWTVSTVIVIVQLGAVLVYGAVLAGQGSLTIGGLLVFLMLEQMLLWPIRQMGMVLADLGKARVAFSRMVEILSEPVEDYDPVLRGPGNKKPRIRGGIEFEDVVFKYPGAEAGALRGVTFSIKPGQTVGVLGATGSGKSSIMMLLSRLYDPDSGTIRIDGHDLLTLDRAWVRQNVAMVLQEPFLFARTIRENISLPRRSTKETDLLSATRSAAIHDVIERFSQGYETPVGERGVTLSGGQKQRVAIARALVTESPVLVFDDSLSAVDTRTDAQIRAALLERGATTFLISHRATTLARTDHVLVLEDGRVVEQGPPDELIAAGGNFARIWNLQQGGGNAPQAG